MYRISENRIKVSLGGVLLILMSVILKNSSEQIHTSKYNNVSTILFLIGLCVTAYSFSMGHRYTFKKDDLTYMNFGAVFLIFISVYQIKSSIMTRGQPNMVWPALFIIGIGLLGYNSRQRILGLISGAIIVISIMGILPWQRRNRMVDGPGMVVLTLGFIGFALANSISIKEKKKEIPLPSYMPPPVPPRMGLEAPNQALPPQTVAPPTSVVPDGQMPPPPIHPSMPQPGSNIGQVSELHMTPKDPLLDYTLGIGDNSMPLPPNTI